MGKTIEQIKAEELMIGDWVYNTHNRKEEGVDTLLFKNLMSSGVRVCQGIIK